MESEWSDEDFYATSLELGTAENGDGDITSSRTISTSSPLVPEATEFDLSKSSEDNSKSDYCSYSETEVSEAHVESTDKPTECCTSLPITEDSEMYTDRNDTVSSKGNFHTYPETGSDDDEPLSVIQSKMRMKKKKNSSNDYPASSDYDDSDRDEDYIPSEESMSDASDTPPIAFDRRKRKWVRKRNRPLKREEGRKRFSFTEKLSLRKKATVIRNKKYKTLKRKETPVRKSSISNNKFKQKKVEGESIKEPGGKDELELAMRKSRLEHNANSILKTCHENRLSNLLISNNLERIHVEPDGNCYFNAVLYQLDSRETTHELRSKLCDHLLAHADHYRCYLATGNSKESNELAQIYNQGVCSLKHDSNWNVELSDLLPLATANIYNKKVTIFSSKLSNPVIQISPDLIENDKSESTGEILLSYLAVHGFEHYDGCIRKTMRLNQTAEQSIKIPASADEAIPSTSTSEKSLNNEPKTPRKSLHTFPETLITPRKSANYISPKKITRTRKRTANVSMWKKNIRKDQKNTGKTYISATSKKLMCAKQMKPHNCNNCKNKCPEKVPDSVRQEIFTTYYKEDMTYERKRDFICQNIEVKSTSKRYGQSYKHCSRSFFLPLGNSRVRVCKQFFLRTLDIGDKLVRYTLARKQHGTISKTDQRGRHTPSNKTTDDKVDQIKSHIESFPVVESHYKRKNSHRKFLEQDLTIRKMYDLYKTKCQEDSVVPASEMVYRKIFCTEFNYSFHKPKKDSCQVCNAYNERKRTNTTTEEDEKSIKAHLDRKEKSRTEKEKDKQLSKGNKSVYTAAFDLEAVLSTPCSNVSQVYYKRKLNSYNLTVYSLADKQGTCYIWDETHGQRGSSEIGTCVITHIKSLPSVIRHVILYSDCCSGQNRNQYLAAGLMHTVMTHPYVHTIDQKFLESGHTQMECDSMHSAIEHAKKRTSIFVPDQWDTVLHMARRNKPYIVIPMRFDCFLNLKSHALKNYRNFKTDSQGNKINWLKIKVLRVSKEYPDEIQVKYEYEENEFRRIKTAKSVRGRPALGNDIERKYSSKLPITEAKKRDLLDLCKSLVIPAAYQGFYEALQTSKHAKDRLPEPDIQEEETDTDED